MGPPARFRLRRPGCNRHRCDLRHRRAPPGALPVQALDHATGYRLTAISLLGAARTLVAYPPPPDPSSASEPGPTTAPIHTVGLTVGPDTIHTVPPALTINGRQITKPLAHYGVGPPTWT